MEMFDIQREYGVRRPGSGLMDSEVARRLRTMRKNKNMSQLEVADRIGVSRTAYLKYESGKGGIPGKSLIQLADLYGTTTDYLLGRNQSDALSPGRASENAAEAPTTLTYIPQSQTYYQLLTLLGTMNDASIDIMLGIAKVIKGHQA